MKLEDGSIIQPLEDAKKSIERKLRKERFNEGEIINALSKIDNSSVEEEIQITEETKIVNRGIYSIRPDLTEDNISDMIPLMISYEYLACNLGPNIYHEVYDDIRNMILSDELNTNIVKVEHLTSGEYNPFHGIAIKPNEPCISIIIRLFGWLTYSVKFLQIPSTNNLIQLEYIHNLEKCEEYFQEL